MSYNFLYKGKTQRYGSEVDIFEKKHCIRIQKIFLLYSNADYLFIFTTVQTKLIHA